MLNYISWKLINQKWQCFIINDKIGLGIEVLYAWSSKANQDSAFFLYNFIDDKNKTIWYLAFDTIDQKILFEQLYKINGVGIKSAYHISFYDIKKINKAVKEVDISFFNQMQWIWPKTAKKILLELKLDIWKEDIERLNIDKKLLNQIIKYFASLWYSESQVKNTLQRYWWELNNENMPEIYKYIISEINIK